MTIAFILSDSSILHIVITEFGHLNECQINLSGNDGLNIKQLEKEMAYSVYLEIQSDVIIDCKLSRLNKD